MRRTWVVIALARRHVRRVMGHRVRQRVLAAAHVVAGALLALAALHRLCSTNDAHVSDSSIFI